MEHDRELRAMLIEQRDRTAARVSKLEADLAALTQARRSESDDDEHDPEGETLSAQWSMLSGVLDDARENARQIEEAMGRLEDGNYGICLSCGQAIPFEQLEARPFREQCVSCASNKRRR